ncbi:hydrogenase maturation nickel metallochaperone HypA [Abyssalbus ytuae]|uniref:Hydrogenase maturation factor HypA n=1 Tax=Abyssalbus ytuae TaxID=2926907 RepID=A0A9E7A014_9FLAO|nr:hydrogenase maturation nickel metallochaperone HypA [Abyssalbus ytuae]UOB17106.1 hydrogenase maturation nickel metallochaperone HypA [Abyssalbus ytuae]
MHELSIVTSIIKIAEEELAKTNAAYIEEIELEIGDLSGIETDALNFVWPAAVKNTALEKASKKINIIKAEAKCTECDRVFEIENIYDPCPGCHSIQKTILRGRELKIKSLKVS